MRELTAAGVPCAVLWCGERFAEYDPAAKQAVVLIPGLPAAMDACLERAGYRALRPSKNPLIRRFVAMDLEAVELVGLEVWGGLSTRDPVSERTPLDWCDRLLETGTAIQGGGAGDWRMPVVPEERMGNLLLAFWASHPTCPHRVAQAELERRRPGGLERGDLDLAAELLGPEVARALGERGAGAHDRLPPARRTLGDRLRGLFRASEAEDDPRLERGAVVAFVGSDGAGKSTATSELLRFASGQIGAEFVYLGSGQGTSSWYRWPFVVAMRCAERFRPRSDGSGAGSGSGSRGFFRRSLRPVWALLLAREKSQKLAHIEAAREQGLVVICDRYPQNEIMGFNDGPLLSHWADSRSRLLRTLSEWEARPYRLAQQQAPDLLVKLQVSEEVALARRPEMAPEESRRRIDAVRELAFGEQVETVTINAEEPLEAVLSTVKRSVWEKL